MVWVGGLDSWDPLAISWICIYTISTNWLVLTTLQSTGHCLIHMTWMTVSGASCTGRSVGICANPFVEPYPPGNVTTHMQPGESSGNHRLNSAFGVGDMLIVPRRVLLRFVSEIYIHYMMCGCPDFRFCVGFNHIFLIAHASPQMVFHCPNSDFWILPSSKLHWTYFGCGYLASTNG